MSSEKKVKLTISAQDKTTAAFGSVKRGLSGMQAAVSKVSGALAAIGVTTVLADIGRQMLEGAKAGELSQRRLQAAIKATGGVAGVTAEQVERLAQTLAASTSLADEPLRDTMATMLTFKQVGRDVFEEAIRLTVDLAEFMGQDLQGSAVQVGKALNDPLTGMTALQRVGVTFSAQQKEQIKNFVAINDLASAQRVILEELSSEFGGAAKAMNTGLNAATSNLYKAWGDLLEQWGRSPAVITPITAALDELTVFLRRTETATKDSTKALDYFVELASNLSALPGMSGIATIAGGANLARVMRTPHSDYTPDLIGVDIPLPRPEIPPAAAGATPLEENKVPQSSRGAAKGADSGLSGANFYGAGIWEKVAQAKIDEEKRVVEVVAEYNKERFSEEIAAAEKIEDLWLGHYQKQAELVEEHAAVQQDARDYEALLAKQSLDEMTVFSEQAARKMQDALSEFLFDPFDGGVKGMVKSFGDAMRKMAAEQLTAQILGKGGGGNMWGLLFSSIVSFFGGGLATGGDVSGSKFYLVGEDGPELFAPGRSGTIIPNHNLAAGAGGGVTIQQQSINIDARGAEAGVEQRIEAGVRRAVAESLERVKMDIRTAGPIRRELRV